MRRKSFLVKRVERKSRRKFFFTVILAILLIYGVFAWFLPTFIGGLSVLNKLKSPPPNQKITTLDDSSIAPPVLNIPFEATNTAKIKIKGYSSPKAKVEIYVDDELKTVSGSADGNFVTDTIELSLGTNNIYGKTVNDKGQSSLPSKPIKVIFSNEKPDLEVTSPQDNQTVNGDKKVEVSGKTNTDKSITITINGSRVIVSSTGSFSKTLGLNDGENNIIIVATDSSGNSIQVTRQVTFQP